MRLCEIPRPWRERALAGSLSGITGGENKFSLERKKNEKKLKQENEEEKKALNQGLSSGGGVARWGGPGSNSGEYT